MKQRSGKKAIHISTVLLQVWEEHVYPLGGPRDLTNITERFRRMRMEMDQHPSKLSFHRSSRLSVDLRRLEGYPWQVFQQQKGPWNDFS